MVDWEKPIEFVSDGVVVPHEFVRVGGGSVSIRTLEDFPLDGVIQTINLYKWGFDRKTGKMYGFGKSAFLRNKEENMIDWTKPLELVDGRKVILKHEKSDYFEVYVEGEKVSRIYDPDGSHYCGELPNIRNRKEPAQSDPKDIIRALLQYSAPMSGLLGVIAREAGERYVNDQMG